MCLVLFFLKRSNNICKCQYVLLSVYFNRSMYTNVYDLIEIACD